MDLDQYDAVVEKALILFKTKFSSWAEVTAELVDDIEKLTLNMHAVEAVQVFALIVDDVEVIKLVVLNCVRVQIGI